MTIIFVFLGLFLALFLMDSVYTAEQKIKKPDETIEPSNNQIYANEIYQSSPRQEDDDDDSIVGVACFMSSIDFDIDFD